MISRSYVNLRRSPRNSLHDLLQIKSEVSEALSSFKPVAALESTIIAHGMPYPQNLEVALEVEDILRSKGVTPATIAVHKSKCQIGLTQTQLKDLAVAGSKNQCRKLTTRDLPLFLASPSPYDAGIDFQQEDVGQWGATTVASTMHLSHLAGISTFITGGTGGVHRGVEATMDISADLIELSRTPVIVISAGIKSILDIPKTLEVLETHSVPVAVYQSQEMPAFYSGRSGIRSPSIVHHASEVADAYGKMRCLRLQSGMLVAVPNDGAGNGEKVETAIQQVLKEVEDLSLSGREVTPYVLRRVSEITRGESLKSNIDLVKRNAEIGADIAIEVAKWNKVHRDGPKEFLATIPILKKDTKAKKYKGEVVVMGGAVVDLIAKPNKNQPLLPNTSNPGQCTESEGGVGRNIAEVLGRLGASPYLFTAVGNDARGKALISHLEEECYVNTCINCHTENERNSTVTVVEGYNTASYLAVLNEHGDLSTAIADMDVLSEIKAPTFFDWEGIQYLIIDANPPLLSLMEAAKAAAKRNVKVFWEPTSVPKAILGARNLEFLSFLTYASPNEEELFAMAEAAGWNPSNYPKNSCHNLILKEAAEFLIEKMNPEGDAHLIITQGADGVLLVSKQFHEMSTLKKVDFTVFDSQTKIMTGNSTGAGDTLCGGFVFGLLEGKNEKEAVRVGMKAATISIQCVERAVSPLITEPVLLD